jgi:UPF0755 protein
MRRTLRLLLILPLLLLAACADDSLRSGASDTSAPSTGAEVSATAPVTEAPGESATGAQNPTGSATNPTAKPSATKKPTAPPTKAPTVPPTKTPTAPQIKSVVIPEGYSFWQIAQRLEANGICKAKAFFDAAQSYTVQSFSVPLNKNAAYRYEGYLFPATYELYTGTDPTEALKKMLNAYADNSGKPSLITLILASVIEKETRSTEQMAMISGVFSNRIKIGMKLGSDATAEYVNKYVVRSGTWIANPDRYRALFNTAWNDNFVGVLPAGPICSPGTRAINAAKNPAKHDYLYFFFGKDNLNHYSKTLAEHEAGIEEFGLGY